MSAKRDPWVKFYFADFRADPRVRLVSRAARSFWLEVLGFMHEATPYGFLLVEGISPSPTQIASLVGDPEKLVKAWLKELTDAGVPSFVGGAMPDDVRILVPGDIPRGTMLSRRMVRDAAKRQLDRENGRRGGNPGITGGVNPTVGHADKPRRTRRWLEGITPRSQKPESPQSPPAVPLPPHPGWAAFQDRAIRMFGQQFCDFWLFPCAIVPSDGDEVVLEAPSRSGLSRVRVEGQRLHDLLGKSVKFRIAEGVE